MIEHLQDGTTHPHDVFVSRFRRQLEANAGRPDWLDVGCGWHFDWPWEHERETELTSRANVVGIDIDSEAISRHRSIKKRAVGALEQLPFRDQSFDFVTANVVMEHVESPALVLAEVHRVLRPGGTFLFRTPSARNYIVRIARRIPQRPKVWLAGILDGRKPEDVYPTHYRVNTSETITEICGAAGFTHLRVIITSPRGVLTRVPMLAALERGMASRLGFNEGNLIAEVQK
jgi:ubiquinone/menaquinone biosynthesis C-methylase UbiE